MKKILMLAALVSLSLQCANETAETQTSLVEKVGSDKALAVVKQFSDKVSKETYAQLDTKAEALKSAVTTLSGTVTTGNIDTARTKWKEARIEWEASEGFLYGPVDTQGIDPAIDSWPLDKTDLDNIVSGSDTLDKAYVDGLNDNVKGFHVVEYLLFDDGDGDGNATSTETKNWLDGNSRRVEYLKAATDSLRGYISTLKTESDTFYDDTMKTAGTTSKAYTSAKSAIEEMVGGIVTIANEVATGKMADPLNGNSNAGDTKIVESRYAYNSLDDFANNLKSILYTYHGQRDKNNAHTDSLYELIKASDAGRADDLRTKIKNAIEKIIAIGDVSGDGTLDYSTADVPFREAITDSANGGRTRVQTAIDAVNEVKTAFEKVKADL